MNNLNNIILEGNCVEDPVLSITSKGTPFCIFSIANNRSYKSGDEYQKEVSFFDIEVWGRLAEVISQYCQKGRGVRVVGRLKQNRWEGEDGKKFSRIRVVAEHVEFKPYFSAQNGGRQTMYKKAPAAAQQSAPVAESVPVF